MRISSVVVAVAAFLVNAPCSAADATTTTKQLLSYCDEWQKPQADMSPYRAAYCMAFIEGVLKGWETAASVRDVPVNYCITPGLTVGQIVAAITKTIRANPTAGKAEMSIISAAQKVFPCSGAAPKGNK